MAWSRSGRAQRNEIQTSAKSTTIVQDRDNKDANETLLKISGRLNGVYNITHPGKKELLAERAAYDKANPSQLRSNSLKGLGASKDEELPLSVTGCEIFSLLGN